MFLGVDASHINGNTAIQNMVIAISTVIGVLVSVVATMALGMFWYSPLGFGNTWIKLQGWPKKQVDAGRKKAMKDCMGKTWLLAILSTIVTNSILALMIGPATALSQTHYVVVVVWLGYIATTHFGSYLWEGKSFKLVMFNSAYNLVALLISATLLYFIA